LVNLYAEHCHGIVIRRPFSGIDPPPRNECIDIGQFLFDLLGYVKFFDASKSDDAEENFYMEREWRTPYNVYFEINDIYRIILPNAFNVRFREDVPEYAQQITFSDEYYSI
jgi:hypothetical protein